MLEHINRHALFHEMHRSIEEAATTAVRQLITGAIGLTYPPNGGLLPEEVEALRDLPKTPALASGLRKVIADAAAYPLFHLLCLADQVADAPALSDIQEGDQTAVEIMLHDGLSESYWAWRRRRHDPGWRLDVDTGS